jgi:predicted PurR-regulated permease PerM
MSIYTIKQSKTIALVLIFILGIFLLYSLKDLVSAILGAIVIYVLFRPLFLYLTERHKFKRWLASVIIILLSFLIIVMPFVTLSIMMVNKILYYLDHPETIKNIIKSIETFAGQQLKQPDFIEDALNRAGNWFVGIFPAFMDTALAILLTVAMMYFFLYFMLTKHEVFEGTLIKYLPFRSRNSEHFAFELRNTTYSNIVGQGLIALVQGGLLAVGFLIFSIPDPVFWGLIAFFLSFLPVIGSPIVFIPAAIIEIATGNTFGGVGILVWGFLLVINIDNVMRLWINKKMGDIHPLITITGVVIGIPVFGILGIVFGPLLISLFILLIRLYEAAFSDNPEPEKEKVISKDDLKGSEKAS